MSDLTLKYREIWKVLRNDEKSQNEKRLKEGKEKINYQELIFQTEKYNIETREYENVPVEHKHLTFSISPHEYAHKTLVFAAAQEYNNAKKRYVKTFDVSAFEQGMGQYSLKTSKLENISNYVK